MLVGAFSRYSRALSHDLTFAQVPMLLGIVRDERPFSEPISSRKPESAGRAKAREGTQLSKCHVVLLEPIPTCSLFFAEPSWITAPLLAH